MKILVTGGAGYIGSHTCIELLNENYDVVVLDNLSNSCEESLNRVQTIAGKSLAFYKADLLDQEQIRTVFADHNIDAVIHFAGLKAVGESVEMPLSYYHNNITGTLNLLEIMKAYSVKNIVFLHQQLYMETRHPCPSQKISPCLLPILMGGQN